MSRATWTSRARRPHCKCVISMVLANTRPDRAQATWWGDAFKCLYLLSRRRHNLGRDDAYRSRLAGCKCSHSSIERMSRILGKNGESLGLSGMPLGDLWLEWSRISVRTLPRSGLTAPASTHPPAFFHAMQLPMFAFSDLNAESTLPT